MTYQYAVLSALLEEGRTALRAFFLRREIPCHKAAFRIILAAVILLALLGLFEQHLFAAERTYAARFLNYPLCIRTIRKT